MNDFDSLTQAPPSEEKATRTRVLINQCLDKKNYEYDFSFKPANTDNPMEVHTTAEMLECLDKNPKIELESRVLCVTKEGLKPRSLDKKSFREAYLSGEKRFSKMREGVDSFALGNDGGGGGPIGQDFSPLLGGPFYKNLYYYQDYIRMHAEAFFAYHHDPIAKAFVSITRDFVLGTGFDVKCDMNTRIGQLAMASWKAFEEANDLQQQIDDCCVELSIYGETLFWELPNNQTKIVYQLGPNEKAPVGIIPRVRLLDPSNMVEIVTYPEDITRKLFYVWLTPTQYQIYTGGLSSEQNMSQPIQPTLKFIYQQIPANEIMHYKVNSVSNEKRGRSDLFPVLGYLKRLRDSVEYSLLALQKASAWSMDTTIDGSQADIDGYVSAQAALGTIPPAASEFVHSKFITRQYLGNSNASSGVSDAFLWCLSMACAGVQIPTHYLGTHLSGGQTRASAVVATEPVIKKMEKRREVIKRILRNMWSMVMKRAGLPDIDCDIIFPELITQDRSAKIKDLLIAEESRWFKPERVANMAAKEMGVTDYDYNDEMSNIKVQLPEIPEPLSAPGGIPPAPITAQDDKKDQTSALTSTQRRDIKQDASNPGA